MRLTHLAVGRRAHPGGDNGNRTRTPALTTRSLAFRLCPPQHDARPHAVLVPPGGLEPPPTGQEPGVLRLTLRRELERAAGFEPAPQGLEGPQATVTPHSPWFGLRYQSLIPGPNTDRWRSPAQELLSVVKDPALASALGDSARIRTRTHEVWRLGCSRYTTLSFGFHVSTVSETNLPVTGRGLSAARRPKQKRPSRGSPQKAWFSMNAGPLGCFPLRIERAAVGAIDPDRRHGSAHTGGDARGGSHIKWPS